MSLRHRRTQLAATLLVAAAGVLVLLWRGRAASSPTSGRSRLPRALYSVLLVTVDTTRADHLAPYGATSVETPVLGSLASEGVLFESAYSVAPITLPAHTSILTGLYPPQHGVRNNGTHFAPAWLETLAERLERRGYRTAAFVSAAVLERQYGLDQGFELYDDDLSSGRERHPRMVPDRPAEATVEAARAWLDGLKENERFFLWVHLYDPHAVYSPPPPFRARYRERLYDGEIAYMDQWIGRLLEHPRLQSAQPTVVSVLGDHGESLGEHQENTHGIFLYDSTLHVPFILRLPGGPRGLRVRAPVGQVDLVPTLLDLLDLPADRDLPGQSALPLIENGERTAEPRPLYSEAHLAYYTYGWAKLAALRLSGYKYLEAPKRELYDLRRDPQELTNQHARQSNRAFDLEQALGELHQALAAEDEDSALELDSEQIARLRALGYLGPTPPKIGDGKRPDPKDVIDLHVGLERARMLERDGLLDAAIRQLRGVLARDPGNLAALTDLASVLEQNGEVEEAVKVGERALELDPDATRVHLILAGLELRRGELGRAREFNRAALRSDPRAIDARLQEIQILRRSAAGGDAAALAEALVAEHPDHPRVLLTHSQVLAARGDLAGARAELLRATARDPFLISAWESLGKTEERLGQGAAAESAYRAGLEHEPDSAELHAALGLLLARRGAEEAGQQLAEGLRLDREFRPDLHVALGAWLAERGRLAEAEEHYAAVLELEPKHPGARNNRAIALYYSGRIAEAERELAALVAEVPEHPDAHNNLAAIAIDRREWQAAERHARRAGALAPSSPQALNNLGVALDEQGRTAEAIGAYERALALEPGYWQAQHNLGIAYRKAAQAAPAIAAFEQVLERFAGHPETHLELGRLYADQLHDGARARHHLNAFLRYAPAHPAAGEARGLLARLSLETPDDRFDRPQVPRDNRATP